MTKQELNSFQQQESSRYFFFVMNVITRLAFQEKAVQHGHRLVVAENLKQQVLAVLLREYVNPPGFRRAVLCASSCR